MIRNISYNRNYIKFINGDDKYITFLTGGKDKFLQHYDGISSFLQTDDGLIIVLSWHPDSTLEERRRNVIKINEDGGIVWTVKDKMDIWKEKFPNEKVFLESEKGACFSRVYMENTRIFLIDGGGAMFFLNPENGHIEFWRAGK